VRRQLLAVTALLGVLPWFLPAGTAGTAAAAEPVVEESVVKCAECGMSAKVANRYTSRLVQGASVLYFCDIGDLAAFIERTHPKEYAAAVHDFASGEWTDVGTAFFVIDKKTYLTPMGWGIAAFRDRAGVSGAPLDFEALRKALK
jgi:nitrous oxide reductase accessory protein NosL